MTPAILARRTAPLPLLAAALVLAVSWGVDAQGRGGPGGAPPPAKTAAPIDVTGYWVSLIVDEWRFRVDPQKGDVLYMPINAAARRMAQAWDPAKDEADGNQCKAYGAVGVMQRPGRLHLTWADDNTLTMEADAGTQTRSLHFGQAPGASGEPTWQGTSVASWQTSGGRGRAAMPGPRSGTLKIVTTNLRPGYLRKNGVPYSDKAVLTEYINLLTGAAGEKYLVVTAMVDDPTYLTQPFVRSYQFKRQPDAAGWDPTPCLAK
ncbi:MAG: hypothetical protein LAP40_12915 [Acidobacteriia bacterium]|nr:hypothetical protein [Terriglobia bacterium]